MNTATYGSLVLATASRRPERVVSNEEMTELIISGTKSSTPKEEIRKVRDRAHEIERKTGLVTRCFFAQDEDPVDVAYRLLYLLVDRAGLPWNELGGLIISSSSIHGFPGLSQQVIAKARSAHPSLGNPLVLDVGSNACTSFLYAVGIADALIRTQGLSRVACLAIEFSSRCVRYDIESFAISTLFGDAAAGVMLGGSGKALATLESIHLGSRIDAQRVKFISGSGIDASDFTAPVSANARWYVDGPPVAIDAIEILVEETQALQASGIRIDWLIPHQANLTRILFPACDRLRIPRDRLCHSFATTGNTSSASIPLLLDELFRAGRVWPGESIVLVSFGASFSVASGHLRVC